MRRLEHGTGSLWALSFFLSSRLPFLTFRNNRNSNGVSGFLSCTQIIYTRVAFQEGEVKRSRGDGVRGVGNIHL